MVSVGMDSLLIDFLVLARREKAAMFSSVLNTLVGEKRSNATFNVAKLVRFGDERAGPA